LIAHKTSSLKNKIDAPLKACKALLENLLRLQAGINQIRRACASRQSLAQKDPSFKIIVRIILIAIGMIPANPWRERKARSAWCISRFFISL